MNQQASRTLIVLRHGPKKGEDLDRSRTKEFEDLARCLVQRYGDSFVIASSGVPRSDQTADLLTDQILRLRSRAKVRRLPPQRKIGFSDHSGYKPYFTELHRAFGGDEFDIGCVWAAWKTEMPALLSHLASKHDKLDPERISPRWFIETPEQKVLEHLDAIEGVLGEAGEEPVLLVGHVPRIDFLHLALERGGVDFRSLQDLGSSRDFLETATYRIDGDRIVSMTYRDRLTNKNCSFAEIRDSLAVQRHERLAEWEMLAQEP